MGYAAKPQRELVLFYPQEAFSSPQLLKASRPYPPFLVPPREGGSLGVRTPGFYSWLCGLCLECPKPLPNPSHHLLGTLISVPIQATHKHCPCSHALLLHKACPACRPS